MADVMYTYVPVQIDTSCMKEAVGFGGLFTGAWGSLIFRQNATTDLMERAAWASTTLLHFKKVWRNRHDLNAELKGLLCPKLSQTEAYEPISLGFFLQLSTAYAALFLPIQTAAFVAELLFSYNQWRSFKLHVIAF